MKHNIRKKNINQTKTRYAIFSWILNLFEKRNVNYTV